MTKYPELLMLFTAKFTYSICLIGFLLIWGDASATAQTHPLAVYLQEGFNAPGVPSGWSVTPVNGTTATWSIVGTGTNPPIAPFAGTGQAKFNSFNAPAGEQARFTSPPLNLAAGTDPFLTFFMYHEDEYLTAFDSVYVEASTADSVSGPWTALAGLRRPRTENRWIKELISLYQYRGMNRLFLSLRGVSKYGNNIFVDEFRVADSTFHDIGAVRLAYNGPQLAQQSLHGATSTSSRIAGRKVERLASSGVEPIHVTSVVPLNLGAIIRNFGTFTEPSYQVSWRIDTQLQSPVVGRPIAARTGRDTLTLTWATPLAGIHTISAWTVLSSDSTRTNDTTQLTIQVLDTATVFYESFNGATFPPANWIVINGDGGTLAPWFRGADTSVFIPLEGSGFAANNFQRANNTYLDDYLITPAVAGVGQSGRVDSLLFWTRSMNNQPAANYPDSLMILLSTGGVDTSAFTTMLDYFAVPKSGWTRKGYRLTGRVPANSTVRVAFRYLLYNVLPSSGSGDFIGVDAVQFVRRLPAGVDKDVQAPTSFALDQNYPNPFNPTTTIRFGLPVAANVTVKIYNVLGQEVARLVDGLRNAGTFQTVWDGRNSAGTHVASGMYFYSLVAKSADSKATFTNIKKMLFLK